MSDNIYANMTTLDLKNMIENKKKNINNLKGELETINKTKNEINLLENKKKEKQMEIEE